MQKLNISTCYIAAKQRKGLTLQCANLQLERHPPSKALCAAGYYYFEPTKKVVKGENLNLFSSQEDLMDLSNHTKDFCWAEFE